MLLETKALTTFNLIPCTIVHTWACFSRLVWGIFLETHGMRMTYEKAHELFEYRDGKLYRRVQRGRRKAGDRAGRIDSKGYWHITYLYKNYREHTLVWFMHHGYWPKMLDHIDGDKLNNKIENLRECNHSTNGQNSRSNIGSASKYKGITPHAGKWNAGIQLNGKQIYIGRFEKERDAAMAYDRKALELFGEFARLNFPREEYDV